MEEEVERPVCRTLFRQASHETRLDPTVPSDSEDSECEEDSYSVPRVVDVLVKPESAVNTEGQFTAVEPTQIVRNEDASPTDNKNESDTSKNETGKSERTGEHRMDQRYMQGGRPATYHESELKERTYASVVAQKKGRPTTISHVENERYEHGQTVHDHQPESVGTLKGKYTQTSVKTNLLLTCCYLKVTREYVKLRYE
jgi:hypothetical protein